MRLGDKLLFGAIRVWSLVAHPAIWRRALRSRNGFFPNPAMPTTDTDKFLWRKVFDHNPLFTVCCDKLAAKDYVRKHAPALNSAAVLWQGVDAREIPHALLTGNVVVKANHGSGWNMIVRGGQFDRDEMLRRTEYWSRHQYARFVGEWGYRNARRRILVEAMLQEPDGRPVATEYKFHTSAGRTCYIYVKRRNADGTDNWCSYERDGNPIPAGPSRPDWLALPLPDSFHAMRDAAERLGQPFDHIRVDLYSIGGEIYFSELTAYPQSGKSVGPLQTRLRNGSWDLRRSWFLNTPQRGWRKRYADALRRWLDDARPAPTATIAGGAARAN